VLPIDSIFSIYRVRHHRSVHRDTDGCFQQDKARGYFTAETQRRSGKRRFVIFFKQKISNAKTEGNNNLLRTVKRMAFNMTNFAHFKARTFAFKT
jgi:hypothetical protein